MPIAIVNIGGRTTDTVVVADQAFVHGACGSLRCGMLDVKAQVGEGIRARFDLETLGERTVDLCTRWKCKAGLRLNFALTPMELSVGGSLRRRVIASFLGQNPDRFTRSAPLAREQSCGVFPSGSRSITSQWSPVINC